MLQLIDYEVIDHGVDHEQYFPECGVANTKFNEVFTGIGDSPYDAGQDAMEQMFESIEETIDEDTEKFRLLEDELSKLSKDSLIPEGEGEDKSEGMHHYVSIRVKVKRE